MAAEHQKQKRAGRRGRNLPWLIGATILLGAAVLAFFLWPDNSGGVHHAYAMAPESALPEGARKAPPKVREAYRFAIANREILSQIPCYCGCGAEHKSDLDCFIKDVRPDGSIVFDGMSLGCGICIDIARDVMRMLDEGKALKEIRAYVDTTYSRFGPSTPTPPVR